jgi:4-carboxymuconolactone decarboxylase
LARVPYVDRENLPEADRPIYDRIARTRAAAEPDVPRPNSFRAPLNSPAAAEAVGGLGEHIRFGSTLDPVAREIAILSVARQTDSDYEWAHHEPVARRVGVNDQVIEAIRSGRAPMGIPAKDGIFAQAAKEMVSDGTLSPRTFQAVEHMLGPGGAVELVVVVGYYAMLSTALSALGIELEPGLESSLNA